MSDYRIEKDSMGEVKVPADKIFGAQTQRSINNFKIGEDRFSAEFIKSFALVKLASLRANRDIGLIDKEKATAIEQACQEVIAGKWDDNFPLVVWQTGSGTQTNMNMNEVLANRASDILSESGSELKVHPNDDINRCQSSNDIFPTAMHVATVSLYQKGLKKSLFKIDELLRKKIKEFSGIIKIGRTHLMDATPITLSQEFSAFMAQIKKSSERLNFAMSELLDLPIGGTAVGTGINAHEEFAKRAVDWLNQLTEAEFKVADNKFAGIAAHDSFINFSSGLKTLAAALFKMANDIRMLGSGPRAGISELILPANEPGSSIMPGKVNPTQCEALSMVCVQVIGNDTAVAFAGASGHFQLNTYKPLIIFNIMHSLRILSDSINSFCDNCLEGILPDTKKINDYLERSLMLVTALNPHIGYDNSAKVAKKAFNEGVTLKKAATDLHLLTEEEFDKIIKPEKMI